MEESQNQEPPAHLVGREFARQYYTLLNKAPEHLHRFYNSQSLFIHCDSPLVVGQKDIQQAIQQINFQKCSANAVQLVVQPTLSGGVLLQVAGELAYEHERVRTFTQTFVLGAETPKKFYVINSIFQYNDAYVVEPDIVSFSDTGTESELTLDLPALDDVSEVNSHTTYIIECSTPQQLSARAQVAMVDIGVMTEKQSSHKLNCSTGCPVKSVHTSTQEDGILEWCTTITSFPAHTVAQPPLSERSISSSQSGPVSPHGSKVPQSPKSCLCSEDALSVSSVLSHLSTASSVNRPSQPLTVEETKTTDEKKLKPKSKAKKPQPQHKKKEQPKQEKKEQPKQEKIEQLKQEKKDHPKQEKKEQLPSEKHQHLHQERSLTNLKTYANLLKANMPARAGQPQTIITTSTFTQSNATPPMAAYITNRMTESANLRLNQLGPLMQRNNARVNGDQRRSMVQYDDRQQLFLGNIPMEATEDELKKTFSRFGTILELRIINKANKLQPFNYGFITYDRHEATVKCLSHCPIYYPEHSPDGQRLNVREKKPRQQSMGNMGNMGNVGNNGQRMGGGGGGSRSYGNSEGSGGAMRGQRMGGGYGRGEGGTRGSQRTQPGIFVSRR